MPDTPRSNLRVMHVVLSMDFGGLERVVLSLLRQGQTLGQSVAVTCLERPGDLAPDAHAAGAEVFCVSKSPGLRPSTVHRLRSVLADFSPDVVHTHQAGALLYAGLAARWARTPLVVHTEHGKHYDHSLRRRWLGRTAARTARRFFCVSQDIALQVLRHRIAPASRVCVVPNGIDTAALRDPRDDATVRRDLGIPDHAPVIGTVGRLSEIKRQDILLRAFALVHRRVPDARLLLVGDGPELAALKRLADELRIRDAVHFAGYQRDPAPYLHAMDVFTLTSRSEGMPLSLLEAWAAGVPVITSAVGGLPELIRHDETGLLVPFGAEEQFARELLSLLTDRARATRLAAAGQRHVESRFDVEQMALAYHRHYQALLGHSAEPIVVPLADPIQEAAPCAS